MMSSTKRHLWINHYLVRILRHWFMKRRPYNTFVSHYDRVVMLFPFLIPIFLLDFLRHIRQWSDNVLIPFHNFSHRLLVISICTYGGLKPCIGFQKSIRSEERRVGKEWR